MSEPNDEAFAESTLTDAIENQIRDGNPGEAKATLNRLMLVGYAREEAITMMASVLAQEVQAIVEQDRAFNLEWYVAALRSLPTLLDEGK
jgi:hypothetical protein